MRHRPIAPSARVIPLPVQPEPAPTPRVHQQERASVRVIHTKPHVYTPMRRIAGAYDVCAVCVEETYTWTLQDGSGPTSIRCNGLKPQGQPCPRCGGTAVFDSLAALRIGSWCRIGEHAPFTYLYQGPSGTLSVLADSADCLPGMPLGPIAPPSTTTQDVPPVAA